MSLDRSLNVMKKNLFSYIATKQNLHQVLDNTRLYIDSDIMSVWLPVEMCI